MSIFTDLFLCTPTELSETLSDWSTKPLGFVYDDNGEMVFGEDDMPETTDSEEAETTYLTFQDSKPDSFWSIKGLTELDLRSFVEHFTETEAKFDAVLHGGLISVVEKVDDSVVEKVTETEPAQFDGAIAQWLDSETGEAYSNYTEGESVEARHQPFQIFREACAKKQANQNLYIGVSM